LRHLLLAILCLSLISHTPAFAAEGGLEDPSEILSDKNEPVNHMGLTAEAAEMAEALNITPLVTELQTLKRQINNDTTNVQLLSKRVQVLERLFMAQMEMQRVMAEIDSEVTKADEMRSFLETRRDRAITLNSVANIFAGGGLGAFGNALQFMSNEVPGEICELVSGTAAAGLSAYAIKQQSGSRQTLNRAPNMLAQLFGCEGSPHTTYPAMVWKYLNSVPPNATAKLTRKELLFRKWERYERIDHRGKPQAEHKIELLAGVVPQQRAVTIDLLDDRAAMLADVRAAVSSMSHGLLELMTAINS
jgi:hypothetical protein